MDQCPALFVGLFENLVGVPAGTTAVSFFEIRGVESRRVDGNQGGNNLSSYLSTLPIDRAVQWELYGVALAWMRIV